MDALVFGGFALLAVWRLFGAGVAAQSVGHVTALLSVALLGYRYASSGRLPRAWGILAFLAAWFWIPVVPLVALWVVGRIRGGKTAEGETGCVDEAANSPEASSDAVREPGKATPNDGSAVSAQLDPSVLSLRAAAEEQEGSFKAFHVPFFSVYGDGVVPVLVEVEGRERDIYVEPGPWDWPAKERCYRWLAGLRTSEREDVEVEIRSDEPVPAVVSFYAGATQRVVFELVGFANLAWVPVAGFAEQNAATLRRLAHEYLDLEIGQGESALASLDHLVVDVLCPDGQILPSTIILLGSLFGEVLISRHGGRWLVRGDDIDSVAVEVSSSLGVVEANVFGKIIKLFRNGMEDSTAFMARSIGDRLGEGAPPA